MCKIICNNGDCKYCSETWYCILESIEISENGVCTCYAEFEDTEFPYEAYSKAFSDDDNLIF